MADIKQAVQDQFGKVAANYLTSAVHAAGADLALLANQMRPFPAASVLDAGCGAGHASAAVAPLVREVVAFDLTATMLEQVRALAAQRGLANIQTAQGDVEALPFEDERFDHVVSRYSAHHWPNPAAALREIRRVLKPGGRFVLSDIVSFDSFVLDTFLQTIELLRDLSHVRDHSAAQWLALFAQAGLSAQVNASWPVPLGFDAWVERIATPPQNVAMIRALFDAAPAEVGAAFAVQPNHDFTLQGALLVGEKPVR
jgi:ubiquinone/menaquinone biosynthesis C-methylase UbiE